MAVADVVVVGAGIAGLATAVALRRAGIQALVLEKSKELRAAGAALSLFPNGLLALDALGVFNKFTFYESPSERALVTDLRAGSEKEIKFTTANSRIRIGAEPRTINRKTLLEVLADELPNGSIRFSSKVAAIETQTQEGSTITILHLDDGAIIKTKVLIGCDGVHSVVAQWLGLGAAVSAGRSAARGLSVFPEGHGISLRFQQYVDVGIRAGFIPLSDKEVYWFFTCTQSLISEGENVLGNPELIQREVIEKYARNFPPLFLEIIRRTDLSTLTWAPLMFRYPWNIIVGHLNKLNITVAGDAMHAMTPELAQGGAAALEDAVILGRHIAKSLIKNNGRFVTRDITEAIDGYVKERRWRVFWLVIGSLLSGWVQQDGSNWWMKFLRDVIFYRLLFAKIVRAVDYDCGEIPSVSFPGDTARK